MTVFNEFSEVYDRMFPWETRLAREGPFLRRLFEREGVRTVLDCACGTGRHVIALNQWGYLAGGSDLSPRMIEAARANARAAGVAADFRTASFTGLDAAFGPAAAFDAVLCIGNSLTLAPSDDDVAAAELMAEYEARISALERLAGRQALEIEFLKGAQRSGRSLKSGPTSGSADRAGSRSVEDAS